MKKHIHESNLIEGYDDPKMDVQGLVAWRYLEEVPADQLDAHCIKKIQKIITLTQTDLQPDWRGYYRTIGVRVGGRLCPPAGDVPYLMDTWLETYKLFSPKEAHIKFEEIHPFVDGNGRTGRMLMWWQELKIGKKPTLILNVAFGTLPLNLANHKRS